MENFDFDLRSIQEARDLARKGEIAAKKMATYSQEQIEVILQNMVRAAEEHAVCLGKMAAEETGFGKAEDKAYKNHAASTLLYEEIKDMKTVGIIDEDPVKHTMDVAAPVGLVMGIVPSTNPTSTTIFKSIIAVKSGNAIVFSPHPSAAKCTLKAAELMRDAAVEAGAPEDIIGIPQIRGETSEFLPPKMIARKEPYVLFLDELNACTQEVQKAFYSLIHERRIGEYHLPEGSIVIGAGNRAEDSAIVKTMSSALLNRMFHVQLKADVGQWIKWAQAEGLHPWVIDYIIQRPDHLFSEPSKTEEPFSTPRSWHMLSDALKEYRAGEQDIPQETLKMMAYACLLEQHAGMFLAYTKTLRNTHLLDDIIAQKAKWPDKPENRDVLYFLAQSFRARLLAELPKSKQGISGGMLSFAYRAKGMIKELAVINFEIAQMTVAADGAEALPDWFMMEIIRDLPRLVG